MPHSPPPLSTFRSVLSHLLSYPPAPPTYHPPFSPPPPILSPDVVASLRLHPTLESALHLLNNDLPSAHFLVRKMQSPPAYEGMYLHAVLHRLEGDFENAKAWYRDVEGSEVEKEGGGVRVVEGVERLLKKGGREEQKWEELSKEGREEVVRVVEFCARKFGEGVVEDARGAYVQSGEKIQKMKEKMTMGMAGDGVRKF